MLSAFSASTPDSGFLAKCSKAAGVLVQVGHGVVSMVADHGIVHVMLGLQACRMPRVQES